MGGGFFNFSWRRESDLSFGEAVEPPIAVFLFVLQIVTDRCMFRRFSDSEDSRDYTIFHINTLKYESFTV